MEFKTRRNPNRPSTARIGTEDLETIYPHNVMLYHLPPIQDITLQTFEDYAIERVNLLRILEQTTAKNQRILSEDWKNDIKLQMQEVGMKNYLRLIGGHSSTGPDDLLARRKDYISHFILRLAYCRSTELRRLLYLILFTIDYIGKKTNFLIRLNYVQMVYHT